MTTPLAVALNFSLASSLALASRESFGEKSAWREIGLWTTLLFQAFVALPCSAYLLYAFPHWSLMVSNEVSLSPNTAPLFALALPVAGTVGFFLTRHLLKKNRILFAWLALFVGLGACGAVVYLGFDRIWLVAAPIVSGTQSHVRRPLTETPLVYLMVFAVPIFLVGWGAAVWRLRVHARAARIHRNKKPSPAIRDASTRPSSGKRPRRTKG